MNFAEINQPRTKYDRIVITGNIHYMSTSPLKQYFEKAGISDPFVYRQDGLPVSYSDVYEVCNDLLYLRSVDGPYGIEHFFPGSAAGLIAYWYTGELVVSRQPMRNGVASASAMDLRYFVRDGQVRARGVPERA